MAAFPLAGFSSEGLEKLFLAISRWADPMTLNPEVIALQRNIFAGQELSLSSSFTRMWEESLSQRFEVTNFVPLMGGQTLRDGEFTVLMLLACGGFSSIYLVRDREGNRLVLKEMIVPANGNDASLKKVHEMFAREATILAKLDHPSIVKVLDHFVETGRNYLALEFVPGLTLRQHVEMRGPFEEEDVRAIGKEICNLMQYLHELDPPIIHRDITPDNIILREPDRRLMLIDFGAANEAVAKVTGTLIGKQCYIPPEQFQGKAVEQSDIYAVGATLQFLLTGQDPEPISSSHPRAVKPAVSPAMDELVSGATATSVEERIGSARELAKALDVTLIGMAL
jgi:serine/threonine-protein kinase